MKRQGWIDKLVSELNGRHVLQNKADWIIIPINKNRYVRIFRIIFGGKAIWSTNSYIYESSDGIRLKPAGRIRSNDMAFTENDDNSYLEFRESLSLIE